MLSNNFNPIIKRVQDDLARLSKQVRQLTTLTERSEVAGGVANYAFADLPTPNKAGMMAYCSDCRKSGEGVGTGTGVLVVVTLLAAVLTWVRADDQTQAAQV